NEEKNIANCLQSIKKQQYPQKKIEIIVVDNYSTDKTVDTAGQFTDAIYKHGPERSAQRNFGAEKAHGKYILIIDADMILSENVIRECFDKCENGGHAALSVE
ncbi:MAG TPA: glycosyltransferase, partial [bacterium]|nr:glycosyltransferase [bacterium]